MIKYNEPSRSKERQEVKNMTLQENLEVVGILNNESFTDEEKVKIQKFVDHYQNLNHFNAYTVGLWATDKAPEKEGELFRITF